MNLLWHRIATAALLLALTSACGITDLSPDGMLPTASVGEAIESKITVCHGPPGSAHVITIGSAAAGAHLAHGDYLTELSVDPANFADDGSRFRRITDALAAARATRVAREELEQAACRITITVAAGTYPATAAQPSGPGVEQIPLVIDVPDVTLRGAHVMAIDETGRPTGASVTGRSSTIVPTAPLQTVGQLSAPILYVNGEKEGFHGHGAIVEGFTFGSGRTSDDPTIGGVAVVTLRVRNVVVQGNRFEKGFSESIDLRAGSGLVARNYLGADDAGGGGTCDICLAGPGAYEAVGNRLLAGGIPGILVVPALGLPVPPGITPYELPASSSVEATLVNNEIRDHLRLPVGVGIRVGAIGIGAPNVAGTARVEARDNLLIDNRFGVIAEAAFPLANSLRRGDIELSLRGNTFIGSCQADLLISLSRHTTGLGLSNAPYLLDSSFTLSLGGDVPWEDAWYSHPDGLGNTLVVDGAVIPHGARTAYDGSVTCVP